MDRIAIILVLAFFSFSKQQYQFTNHLSGTKTLFAPQVFGTTGQYDSRNTIGAMRASTSFLITNNTEIIVFFGRMEYVYNYNNEINQVWKYSLIRNEWMFLKGDKGNTTKSSPIFNELQKFEDTNLMGERANQRGWVDEKREIITFFGGNTFLYPENWLKRGNNQLCKYNISSNSFAIFRKNFYQDVNNHDLDAYIEGGKLNYYDQKNIPLARCTFIGVTIDNDEVMIIGGYTYGFNSLDTTLGDWWIYSNSKNMFKYLGGSSVTQSIEPIYGSTNVYDSGNNIGTRQLGKALLINEEEILLFGGMKNKDMYDPTSLVQKYNISNNQWKYISGSWSSKHGKGYFREFSELNKIGSRHSFGMFKINNEELLVFGGYGESANQIGSLSDTWVFNFHKNKWKFTGKESTKYPNRYIIDESDENTLMGGMYDFVGEYVSSRKEIIICNGRGYSRVSSDDNSDGKGVLDDCWRIFLGKKCNGIEEKEINVCSNVGKCIGFNKCDCIGEYYGNDCELTMCSKILSNDTEVCSKKGVCIEGVCLCFDQSPYNKEDCSVDEQIKSLMENLWIYISIPIISCFILILFILIIIGSVVLYIKLKKTLKKFDGIDNIEIILEEAKLEQNSTNPKIKIDKSLFEIDKKDVKLLKIIGEGGSNSVCFLAEWKGNLCCYKSYHVQKGITSSGSEFNEFEKEVEIFSSIHHPSILQFYGACINLPKIGIVLEFCQNGDIPSFFGKYQYKHNCSYPIKEKIRLIEEITSGMEYIHSKWLIHRDLKPENVLIDSQEKAKIMDFGLTKFKEKNMDQTMTKRIGTSFFMAPEVINGTKYDNKCDVYSWAIMVYTIITDNFCPFGINIDELVLLKKVSKDPNFRPSIKESDFKECKFLISIIKKNWDVNCEKRDNFTKIKKNIAVEKEKIH